MHILYVILFLTIAWKESGAALKCGYDSCHAVNQSKINVHIVPHSHDDVGWLRTMDEYYYNEVQQILSSVIEALVEDSNRRFIQVETAFFYKWWSFQTQHLKSIVKQLVEEGRLEIVNGAWSMNDEATVHYQSIVDQFTLGLRFVQDNLGSCARPRTSWQIDTFGHSREYASLVSQFGMDAIFFARLDYRDKAKRLKDKAMEMLWTGSASLGSDSNVFTSVLYHNYSPPPKFCFDILCQDEAIVNDTDSFEYNWETRVTEFAEFIEEQAQYYKTNNILITMGGDFHYQAAPSVFLNLDKLILGFQKFNPKINGKEVNLFYSTPSCYSKAVHDYVQEKKLKLHVKTDDFLPYATGPNVVWTGYFTSRPNCKKLERLSNNMLQVSKQLGALAGKPYESNAPLSHAMGVMQHHNAITGTGLDYVAKDYQRLLANGIEKATLEAASSFSSILGLSKNLNLTSCPQLNVSVCSVTTQDNSNKEFTVIVYNPLARNTSHYVHIPVRGNSYEVVGPTGEVVESHMTTPVDYFTEVPGSVYATLIFKADNLPALGYKVYKLRSWILSEEQQREPPQVRQLVDQIGFEDRYVNFDLSTGRLKSITLFGSTLEFTQQFLCYKSGATSNSYIFTPAGEPEELRLVENKVLINDGNLIREVHQTFRAYGITQIIRIYKDKDFIEFDWVVGSQDVGSGGREFVIRYTPNLLQPHEDFYTDANGREMMQRKKNNRETYNYTDEQPQSGNYYPVNTRIVVKNDTHEFAVMTDRSQGGTSLNPGQIELMIARQIPDGLDEHEFDKPVKIRGAHYVTHGVSAKGNGGRTMAVVQRDIVQRKLLQPWLFFTTDDIPVREQSFLNKELPPNVHLLTLESWDSEKNALLIRLEHILEKEEDPDLSKKVTVDMTDVFKPFVIHTMKEHTLAANVPLEESDRLNWSQLKPEDASSPLSKSQRLKRAETDLKITLAPMQIRTFVVTVEPRV